MDLKLLNGETITVQLKNVSKSISESDSIQFNEYKFEFITENEEILVKNVLEIGGFIRDIEDRFFIRDLIGINTLYEMFTLLSFDCVIGKKFDVLIIEDDFKIISRVNEE